MRPLGFDKRAYALRGLVLAILLVLAAGYWDEWLRGRGGFVMPILTSLASTLIIVLCEHKRYLIILSLRMLGALALVGVFRAFVTGESVLLGLILFGVIIGAMILLGSQRPDTEWLLREDGLGEGGGSLELNLRSATPPPGEKSQDSSSENQPHQDSKARS